jgi:hypothetical protein
VFSPSLKLLKSNGRRPRKTANSGLRHALKLKSDSQPHIVFLVLVTENVTVVRGELFILVAESLTDRQLM